MSDTAVHRAVVPASDLDLFNNIRRAPAQMLAGIHRDHLTGDEARLRKIKHGFSNGGRRDGLGQQRACGFAQEPCLAVMDVRNGWAGSHPVDPDAGASACAMVFVAVSRADLARV